MRFSRPDVVRGYALNPQTVNRYAYCVNNPVMYADPSGEIREASIASMIRPMTDHRTNRNPVSAQATVKNIAVVVKQKVYDKALKDIDNFKKAFNHYGSLSSKEANVIRDAINALKELNKNSPTYIEDAQRIISGACRLMEVLPDEAETLTMGDIHPLPSRPGNWEDIVPINDIIRLVRDRTLWRYNESLEQQRYTGKPALSSDVRTVLFAINHPIIAAQIGKSVNGKGYTNISTNATRYSRAFNLDASIAEGSEVNAVRHAIWTATLSSRYGPEIARIVNDAHEDNPGLINELDRIEDHIFMTRGEADLAADLLNNIIGRELGANYSETIPMGEITRDVLTYYNTNGLFVVSEYDNMFYVVKQKISDAVYNDAIAILETLDENGFPPGDKYYQKDR